MGWLDVNLRYIFRVHWHYAGYVVRHKWFCFVECCKLGIPWRGILHDMSKVTPGEWFPYAHYFYGCDGDPRGFDRAWLQHQHRNDHHWQHWVLRYDNGDVVCLAMPDSAIREMVADWRAAGRAISGVDDTVTWYRKCADIIQINPQTRKSVEAMLGIAPEVQE